MPSFPERRADPALLLLLAAGALLLLLNLGEANGRLWQDEAETAVLAKNILHYGYPRAFDGVNRLNPALPLAAGEAWTYHPWLSMYILAGSFALLGATTFAARLPFALMGLASIALFYRLVLRMTGDRSLARWAGALLAVSVPFLLLMRQCRYYAPSVLFSLWAVRAYWRFLDGGRWAAPELAVALVLLFHTNHGVFAPVAVALAGHFIFTRYPVPDTKRGGRYSSRVGKAIAVAAVVLALTVPFAFLLQAGQHHGPFSWKEVSHHAQFYFRQINKFILPVVPWAAALALWRPRPQALFGGRGSPSRRSFGLAAWLIGVGLLFFILGPVQRHFRYLVFLIPWLLLVHAALLRGLFRCSRIAGGLALLLVAFTLEAKPRCLLLEFTGELTHAYRGPMDGVVDLLSKRAKPGQTIKIPYGDHTILFYDAELVLEPILHPEDFLRETYPDWIVVRRDWIPGSFFGSPYEQEIRRRYKEHVLDVADIPWQNRPDPGYHRFRTPPVERPVIVYEKAP